MHFLDLDTIEREDLLKILKYGEHFKKHRKNHEKFLENKSFGIIFEKPSTRTRISFDLAIHESGGHLITLNKNEIHLGRESLKDMAKVLSRYLDGIIARVYSHKMLEELAKYSEIPVINALSDIAHPCQTLADLLTIKEIKGFNIKLAYLGDGNNVCNSLILGASLVGIDMYVATPKGYEPNSYHVLKALENIEKYGEGSLTITNSPEEALKEADVIYTDVWVSMGDKKDENELKYFKPFQINNNALKLANDDCIVMHCLPAVRGNEITDDVIDSEKSVIYQQAENRLHAQKGLLKFLY